MMKKTNFDNYLKQQLQDPEFAARFAAAGEAWDVALQIAELRRKSGLSQKELAKLLYTSQQQISRLESSGYEGHSLSMLRRVAHVLHARVRVVFEPEDNAAGLRVAESEEGYKGVLLPLGMIGKLGSVLLFSLFIVQMLMFNDQLPRSPHFMR